VITYIEKWFGRENSWKVYTFSFRTENVFLASHQRAVWSVGNLRTIQMKWCSWVVMEENCFLCRGRNFCDFLQLGFSFLKSCQLRLKHMASGNFRFTVLIALTLSHEQMYILSPLPILISLLSTGRNVFLHVAPWLQSLIYRDQPPPPQHTEFLSRKLPYSRFNHWKVKVHILCHTVVMLYICHSPSDIYFIYTTFRSSF
jgi:hypothetical protein